MGIPGNAVDRPLAHEARAADEVPETHLKNYEVAAQAGSEGLLLLTRRSRSGAQPISVVLLVPAPA
jgi:hypothetical protein